MEFIDLFNKYFYIVALVVLLVLMAKPIYKIGVYLSIVTGLNKKPFKICLNGVEYHIDPKSNKFIVEQMEEQDKLRNRGNENE